LKFADFLTLWHAASRRKRAEADYRHFQAVQAQLVTAHLASHGVPLAGQRLLDLGSGLAGYSQVFAVQGARVVSVDLLKTNLPFTTGLSQVQGDALSVPLASAAFDVIFCASLIEHVADPLRLLLEIQRLLKPGGTAYVSFPPYYSIKGGHEFSPFHYLGQKAAMRIVANRKRSMPAWVDQLYHATDQVTSFSDLYQGWGLFIMTIRRFRRLLRQTDLVLKDMSTRYMPVSFIRWPLLGEFLTWHAQFLLHKPALPEGSVKRENSLA
jgi:2-polyprenyl-3-methyl-5-hydroxy-6-metoxy-1,4-benzoquinol methylase